MDFTAAEGASREELPQQALSVQKSFAWAYEARKLKSTDREAASPSIELVSGQEQVHFKMIIRPVQVSEMRGGFNFKSAKGKGHIQLRCSDDVCGNQIVTWRIRVGDSEPTAAVRHNFSDKALCSMPGEPWDFSSYIREGEDHVLITLEVMADEAPRWQ